jgi:hypothetical protein
MRLNERELNYYSSGPALKEGRIYHKNPNAGFREGFNCFLFCYQLINR